MNDMLSLPDHGPASTGASHLLARIGIRADQPTVAIVARVLSALAEGAHEPPPRLSHDEAGPIGEALARQWALLVGTPAPDADDFVWADLVQFVLRLSRERAEVSGARP